jgi:integrase
VRPADPTSPAFPGSRKLFTLKPLIDEILAPERSKANDPIAPGVLTLSDFIRYKYMPYVREKKKPSTADGYDDIFRLHVEPNVGNIALEDFGAPEAQQLMDKLVKKGFTTRTCLHIKSFLSGAVSYAIRTEAMAGPHPLAGRGLVVIEGGKESTETHAYSLDEILERLEVIDDETQRTALVLAAFTGLSLPEMRGLQWEDIQGDVLKVERSFVRELGTTKVRARWAPVPLLPDVAEALAAHKERNPETKFVFQGRFEDPLDLATLGSKQIKRKLEEHGLAWHGWHAFRRGLATNLHELGVPDKEIQAILRHANISTTRDYYIKTRESSKQAAMKRLSEALKLKQRG